MSAEATAESVADGSYSRKAAKGTAETTATYDTVRAGHRTETVSRDTTAGTTAGEQIPTSSVTTATATGHRRRHHSRRQSSSARGIPGTRKLTGQGSSRSSVPTSPGPSETCG